MNLNPEFIRDPALEEEFLSRLQEKYLSQERPLPHLTELIYCLTRSYFDRNSSAQLTDKETLLFAIGFALESVIIRDLNDLPPSVRFRDGVYMHPDYIPLAYHQGTLELDLKTTRMFATELGEPKKGWPETWIRQFMGYAYTQFYDESQMPLIVPYGVAVLFLGQPSLTAGLFKFRKEDLMENWQYIQTRKETYLQHIVTRTIPKPFTFNYEWECDGCRYRMVCDAMVGGSK